jgi:hypothetical protein
MASFVGARMDRVLTLSILWYGLASAAPASPHAAASELPMLYSHLQQRQSSPSPQPPSTKLLARINRTASRSVRMLHTSKSAIARYGFYAVAAALVVILLVTVVWPTFLRQQPAQHPLQPHEVVAHRERSLPIPPEAAGLTHLIMVAGHAVLTSLDVHDLSAPENWWLMGYQKDQVGTFVKHIQRGVELAREDPAALLVFSGGETRSPTGPRSEAQSYWIAADHAKWWNPNPESITVSNPDPVSFRATTDEYARDSHENLIFSLCRFKEFTGAYPKRVTVVGFDFKRARFTDVHRAAIRFPLASFSYSGIDPPEMADPTRKFKLLQGERTKSVQPFLKDPYGCAKDGPLYAKRVERNPFRRQHAYELVCPELIPLLRWCETTIFPGELPWSREQPPGRTIGPIYTASEQPESIVEGDAPHSES